MEEGYMKQKESISVQKILEEVRDGFQQIAQWNGLSSIGNKLEHYYKTEALVELLEVFDCGSVGGFGEGQEDNNDLYARFLYLRNKYAKELSTKYYNWNLDEIFGPKARR
jgi:hypothetical protein